MFTILEMQTDNDGHTAVIVTEYTTRLAAESAWHTAMASAAISTVPIHTVKVFNANQTEILTGTYDHRAKKGGE